MGPCMAMAPLYLANYCMASHVVNNSPVSSRLAHLYHSRSPSQDTASPPVSVGGKFNLNSKPRHRSRGLLSVAARRCRTSTVEGNEKYKPSF